MSVKFQLNNQLYFHQTQETGLTNRTLFSCQSCCTPLFSITHSLQYSPNISKMHGCVELGTSNRIPEYTSPGGF